MDDPSQECGIEQSPEGETSVRDEYGFDVDVGLEAYVKQAKRIEAKEEDYAKKWEVLFLKHKRKDDELFNSSTFKKLVEKGIPIQYQNQIYFLLQKRLWKLR